MAPQKDAPWIDQIRHQLTELRLRALECYAAAALGLGGTELAAAVRAGRQLTRLAPLRESGYRYLMQALAGQDNLAEALGVYGQLSECLRDQLGVSPSPPPPASCTSGSSPQPERRMRALLTGLPEATARGGRSPTRRRASGSPPRAAHCGQEHPPLPLWALTWPRQCSPQRRSSTGGHRPRRSGPAAVIAQSAAADNRPDRTGADDRGGTGRVPRRPPVRSGRPRWLPALPRGRTQTWPICASPAMRAPGSPRAPTRRYGCF